MIIAAIILGILFLIIAHELGHFITAKFFKMRVDEFGVGLPPRLFGRKWGETIYSLNWLPLGGFVRIRGEDRDPEDLANLSPEEKSHLFMFQSPGKKALVIVAGVLINFLVGWMLLSAVFFAGTPTLVYIDQIAPGSPAEMAGLSVGDVIFKYAALGEAPANEDTSADHFLAFVNDHRGQPVSLEVMRTGKNIVVKVTPRLEPPAGEGALGLGFREVGIEPQSFPEAIGLGLEQSIEVVKVTFSGLGDLLSTIFRKGSVPDGVVGPVGIFSFAYDSGRIGLVYLLQVLGLISINLAVLNLLPFPALDGGQLVFIVIEKVRGTLLKTSTKSIVNTAGLLMLLLLIVLISVRDISGVLS